MKDLHITLHLEAESADELSIMTVNAQVHWNMQLNFFDFTQTKKGLYICWYNMPHGIWVEKLANG